MAELGLLAGDIFLKFLQIYMLLTSIVPGVYEEVSGESDHGLCKVFGLPSHLF
jgi:hypothetical protein